MSPPQELRERRRGRRVPQILFSCTARTSGSFRDTRVSAGSESDTRGKEFSESAISNFSAHPSNSGLPPPSPHSRPASLWHWVLALCIPQPRCVEKKRVRRRGRRVSECLEAAATPRGCLTSILRKSIFWFFSILKIRFFLKKVLFQWIINDKSRV